MEIMALVTAYLGIILVISIVPYIIQSIGLYKTAAANGENAILAWLPVGREYLIGRLLGDKLTISNYTIPGFSVIYPAAVYGAGAAGAILSAIPFVGGILSFVFSIAVAVVSVMTMIRFSQAMGRYDTVSCVLFVLFPWLMMFITGGTPVQNTNGGW